MKLGYLCRFDAETLSVAKEIGFDCIEAQAGSWPADALGSADGRKAEAEKTNALMQENGVSISAISNYDTQLTPADQKINRFANVIEFAKLVNVDVITAMAGGETAKTLEENLELFKAVFGSVSELAEDAGVKIAFENWPALSSRRPPMGSRNIAATTEGWEAMFNTVPSEALGLEFDPSHLVWQGVDYLAALRRFGSRVYHVHAKDTEIIDDRLEVTGFFGGGWWRYRIPGFGRVNWAEFVSILREVGYDGGVAIEHEDPVFSGERFKMGLVLGYRVLSPLIQT